MQSNYYAGNVMHVHVLCTFERKKKACKSIYPSLSEIEATR